jgi:hypothetical protein
MPERVAEIAALELPPSGPLPPVTSLQDLPVVQTAPAAQKEPKVKSVLDKSWECVDMTVDAPGQFVASSDTADDKDKPNRWDIVPGKIAGIRVAKCFKVVFDDISAFKIKAKVSGVEVDYDKSMTNLTITEFKIRLDDCQTCPRNLFFWVIPNIQ